MKRTHKESIHIFFKGYSDNKEAQIFHLIKRLIWLFCAGYALLMIISIIKYIAFFDIIGIFYSIAGLMLFAVPLFLIKLD